MSVIDPIRAAQDRNVQLERRLAEARRSIAADGEQLVNALALLEHRERFYSAARAYFAYTHHHPAQDAERARLHQAAMAAHRATTPEPEEAA